MLLRWTLDVQQRQHISERHLFEIKMDGKTFVISLLLKLLIVSPAQYSTLEACDAWIWVYEQRQRESCKFLSGVSMWWCHERVQGVGWFLSGPSSLQRVWPASDRVDLFQHCIQKTLGCGEGAPSNVPWTAKSGEGLVSEYSSWGWECEGTVFGSTETHHWPHLGSWRSIISCRCQAEALWWTKESEKEKDSCYESLAWMNLVN